MLVPRLALSDHSTVYANVSNSFGGSYELLERFRKVTFVLGKCRLCHVSRYEKFQCLREHNNVSGGKGSYVRSSNLQGSPRHLV